MEISLYFMIFTFFIKRFTIFAIGKQKQCLRSHSFDYLLSLWCPGSLQFKLLYLLFSYSCSLHNSTSNRRTLTLKAEVRNTLSSVRDKGINQDQTVQCKGDNHLDDNMDDLFIVNSVLCVSAGKYDCSHAQLGQATFCLSSE